MTKTRPRTSKNPPRTQGQALLLGLPGLARDLAAGLGTGEGQFSTWVNGHNIPSRKMREKIESKYGIPISAWDQAIELSPLVEVKPVIEAKPVVEGNLADSAPSRGRERETEVREEQIHSTRPPPSSEVRKRGMRVLRDAVWFAKSQGWPFLSKADEVAVDRLMDWVGGTCGGEKWRKT